MQHPPQPPGAAPQPYAPQASQPQPQPSPPGVPAGYGQHAAAPLPPEEPPPEKGEGPWTLVIDKFVDFLLIFVGLYAATSVQRWQDTRKEKAQYVKLLQDFDSELQANRAQEASIEKDLGKIDDSEPGTNLGPMQDTFKRFFAALHEDELVVQCLHDEFMVNHKGPSKTVVKGKEIDCHSLYAKFDENHEKSEESFVFEPAVLTPFYRTEVWQLYLADGVKTFRNKELAVKLGEVYANARLIEQQVADIEATYNDNFMVQVGRTAATDQELAEVVHDEETRHELSGGDLTLLTHVDEAVKAEHYGALEAERILELKVQRMKETVLLMRQEITDVRKAITVELADMGSKEEAAEE